MKNNFHIDENGCWVWLGHLDRDGYPQLSEKKHRMKAHRYYYNIYKGAIPHDCELDHTCCNRKCVNPDHLEAVSHLENVRRAYERKNNKVKEIYNEWNKNNPL